MNELIKYSVLDEKSREALAMLLDMKEEFNSYFQEREEEVTGMFVALLAGEHLLLIGRPGTAKSMMTERLCKNISDAKYLYHLLTKYVTDKDLFVSQITVQESDTGNGKAIQFRNDPSGMLGECHIAFADEIFLCSHTSLTSTLQLLATRTYSVNAGEVLTSPLITLVGASNQLPGPEDGYLLHLLDRFLLRYRVDYITDPSNFLSMMREDASEPAMRLTLEELNLLQSSIARVPIADSIYHTMYDIRWRLQQKDIYPSDRRFKVSKKLLQAYALLEGREYVDVNDLEILQHSLWTAEDEVKPVREIVLDVANPHLGKAIRFFEEATEVFESALQKDPNDRNQLGEMLEAEIKLRQLMEELDNLPQSSARIKTLRNKVNVYLKHLKLKEGVDNPFSEGDMLPAHAAVKVTASA